MVSGSGFLIIKRALVMAAALVFLLALLSFVVPSRAFAASNCGSHIHVTENASPNALRLSFRVAGVDLGEFFGPGGHGLASIEMHDAGEGGEGLYPASSDTGFNVPITITPYEDLTGMRGSIFVSIMNVDRAVVYCTGSYILYSSRPTGA
jgi:hypothetical protein